MWTGSGIARLELMDSTRATSGYGYGSNAPSSERRAMARVREHKRPIRLVLDSWEHGKAQPRKTSEFTQGEFTVCGGSARYCMTYLQPPEPGNCGNGCGQAAGDTSIQYYLTT